MAVRCLIVDDNPGFLRSTRHLLEQEDVTVVGTATTSAEALHKAGTLHPDVMLVDIDLGDENGFDLARQLDAARGQHPGVILISGHSGRDFADMIAASPVLAFLPKSGLSGGAIRAILAGQQATPRG